MTTPESKWIKVAAVSEVPEGEAKAVRMEVGRGRIYPLGDCRISTQNAGYFSLVLARLSCKFMELWGFSGPSPN